VDSQIVQDLICLLPIAWCSWSRCDRFAGLVWFAFLLSRAWNGGCSGLSVLDTERPGGAAVMFLFTATSHFTPMRKDLIAMVPPGLPRPDLLVLLTGIAELAGAIGLLIPATRYWAAWGLMVLMAVMLPANISAAKRGVLLRGQPATRLWVRIPMQVLFIGWAWLIK
jgi:uncharacterized membrane protein